MSFVQARYQPVVAADGSRRVELTTMVGAADARALSDALAWQRAREFLAPAVESFEQVLALRALVRLVDQLDEVADKPDGGPLVLNEPDVAMLAEVSTTYVAERDTEEHQARPERERIARLRDLTEPLFDLVAHLALAREEAWAT